MSDLKTVMVHRVHRQHGSLLVVIPILITSALAIEAGNYVVFSLDKETNIVELSKFKNKDIDRA